MGCGRGLLAVVLVVCVGPCCAWLDMVAVALVVVVFVVGGDSAGR